MLGGWFGILEVCSKRVMFNVGCVLLIGLFDVWFFCFFLFGLVCSCLFGLVVDLLVVFALLLLV